MYVQLEDQPAVRFIRVDGDHAGQRIDNFLLTHLKGVPKSHVYRLVRTGQVRLNGGRIDAGRRLNAGDIIRLPPLRRTAESRDPVPVEGVRSRLEQAILFEDSELLLLNKPAGMAVHGGSGVSFGVIEGLRVLRPHNPGLDLAHRLDRDTSGCLVIAKKRSALRTLHEQFRSEAVEKTYLALLDGAWSRSEATVDAPLRKNLLQSGERLVKVSDQGKPSVTRFRRLARYACATLVEARPLTGRTHQIRVHAKTLGHPIAGDERYGMEASNRAFREWGLRRLFLHAASLTLRHPKSGEMLRWDAPLDAELERFLQALKR